MLSPRPVPPDLTVADLDPDDVYTQCPKCLSQLFHLGYNVLEKVRRDPKRFPLGDATLVADYVAKHVCRTCSRPGHPVRAQGWLQPHARSGAESFRQRTAEIEGLIEF